MAANASIEAAFALHQAGKLAEAEQLYRVLLEAEPDNLNCLQLLGVLATSTGRPAEAVALLERARAALSASGREAGQHAALYNNLGNALKATGRVAAAADAYRRGLELDPRLPSLHANLGIALLSQGQFVDARTSFVLALRLDPSDPETWCNLAAACGGMGQHEGAVAACEQALLRRPGDGPAIFRLADGLAALGRFDQAITALRTVVATDPGSWSSRFNLARILLMAKRHREAADLFVQLAAERPDDASVHLGLAQAYGALERLDLALDGALRLLALCPDEAIAHYSVARILHRKGNIPGAEVRYRDALRLQPEKVEAGLQLGVLLVDANRHVEAIDVCRQVLDAEPQNPDANCVLGSALLGVGDHVGAINAFVGCLRVKPDSVPALYRLGVALARQGFKSQAVEWFERAIALQPDHASALGELGNALQNLGRSEEARAAFLRAQRLRPITTVRGTQGQADFSILVVTAPGAGNTPFRYLIGNSTYDSHFLGLLPELALDPDGLTAKGDVVVNLISDPDQGHEVLSQAMVLIDRLDRPVVNHPRKILATGREMVAAALVGIPACRVPQTRRHSLEDLSAPDVMARLAPFSLPLLLRQPGTHGGDAFEKIDHPDDIASFVAQYPGADYYVTEWVDYASEDGYFRKYRLMFTDAQIFPYHLAIHDHWKVHHYRTAMDSHPWMQQEEAAFLGDPGRVFGDHHYAALRAIQARTDLEFFGIDCSVDRDGNLVVFEVNASMLVHDDNADYPYKAPYVTRIKQAFDAMLARMAAADVQGVASPPPVAAKA
jgi:tetratricopeptide (TPR) repeat protein